MSEKFEGISIYEIAEFWIESYPEDIFIKGPYPIVEIRELFKKLLELRKK